MRAIGLNFQKGKIRVVTLVDDGKSTSFESRDTIIIDPNLPLPELADRYVRNFRNAVDKFVPDIIAARQVYESGSIDASVSQIMPLALLAFVANERRINLSLYTMQALNAPVAFGLVKPQKPIDEVDGLFGSHAPYWDSMHRTALLVAWRSLREARQ